MVDGKGEEGTGRSWLKRLLGNRAAPHSDPSQPPKKIPITEVVHLSVKEMLLAFIEDEDYAIATGKQGYLWPSHHGLIASSILKAGWHLSEDQRTQAYFHYLRLNKLPPALPQGEFSHLVTAYRKIIPILDSSSAYLARRHILLFCFGFDERGSLPDGATTNPEQLKDFTKFIVQCQKYTSLPGQRAKVKNFTAFAHHSERLYQTLKHLGYRYDRRYGDTIWSIDLVFWGMVLTILLNEKRGTDLLHDFLRGDYKISFRDKNLPLLHMTAQAVLTAKTVPNPLYQDLVDQLALASANAGLS